MNRRELLGFFAAGVASTVLPTAASAEERHMEHAPVEIPEEGATIRFGYRSANGLVIEFDHTGGWRDSFNYESLYYFPGQRPENITHGYRQSSSGSSAGSITSADGTVIPEYSNSLRDGLGGEYELDGSPIMERPEDNKMVLKCSLDPDTGEFEKTEDLEPLTPAEITVIEARINSGAATLYNPPAVFGKEYVYSLPTGEYMAVLFDYSVWPQSGIKAFIGAGTDWREVQAEYGAPDGMRRSGAGIGINTSEGFLRYNTNPTDTSWLAKTDEGYLDMGKAIYVENEEHAFGVMEDLANSPIGHLIKPEPIRNPCEILNMM